MRAIKIIANPAAGRGRGARIIPLAEHYFNSVGLDFELYCTRGPGHAAELARAVSQGGDHTVVALGGDGTVNEVVNGLLRSEEIDSQPGSVMTLGIIPAGSGNDLSYPLDLPTDPEAACRCIVRGRTRAIDIGMVQAGNEKPRFFVNGVGVGFDAAVSIENRKIRRFRGKAAYLLALLRTVIFYYSAPRVKVLCDDKVYDEDILMLTVMNGRRLGGVFQMASHAILDDGFFDLVISRRTNRFGILRMIAEFIRGSHIHHSKLIKMARARQIIIDIDGTLPAHVDGEVYNLGAHHYEINNYPRRLRVLC